MLKALTVWNPHAGEIIAGRKTIEYRPTGWSHRGLLVIHAGLRWDPRAGQPGFYPHSSTSLAGCILGVVELRDVHEAAGCHRGELDTYGRYHLELRKPRRLATPIMIRGRQGLWVVPDSIEARIREALRLGEAA